MQDLQTAQNLVIGALIIILTRIPALHSAHITFFNCTFRFYNCTNCVQLHSNICSDHNLYWSWHQTK